MVKKKKKKGAAQIVQIVQCTHLHTVNWHCCADVMHTYTRISMLYVFHLAADHRSIKMVFMVISKPRWPVVHTSCPNEKEMRKEKFKNVNLLKCYSGCTEVCTEVLTHHNAMHKHFFPFKTFCTAPKCLHAEARRLTLVIRVAKIVKKRMPENEFAVPLKNILHRI